MKWEYTMLDIITLVVAWVLIIVGSASLYLMRQDMTIDHHQEYMEIYKQQQIMNERILDVQTFPGVGNS